MHNRKGGEEEVANLLPLCGRFPSLDSRFLDARARRMLEEGREGWTFGWRRVGRRGFAIIR